jgi:1,4-alpha-glucan branching enzyme
MSLTGSGAQQLGATDLFLFNEGTHRQLASKLGAQLRGDDGIVFSVWAPNARAVSVIGDFNGWNGSAHPLSPVESSGIWSGIVAAHVGDVYKFAITTADGSVLEKADPFAFACECPPRTGSVVADLAYEWSDDAWMTSRGDRTSRSAPVSIYELHLGSWTRSHERPDQLLSYTEIAPKLIAHVQAAGFTHVEFLPLMEHPFYGSWGYQTTGFFAPTARYGSPQDLMSLIDELHQAEIGVLLDWVPSHFPTDAFALGNFDGTHLYEHADERQGFHPDWKSYIFNYGRNEVRSFLLSSAEHWLSRYHADGLRVDAVASMLYLDYSRQAGEWIPNRNGGRENLEAISFLQDLNIGVYGEHPGAQTVAEESTAWSGVSTPTDHGGLGFGYKWDMGWMNDTLKYFHRDPIYRGHHHDELTFRSIYAFSENYVLPLSHDEVVHGKGSLIGSMPGDNWQRFANLRLLYGYQYALPGKKLLFMGDEIGQWREWNHDASLDWHLLEYPAHEGILRFVSDLNTVYRAEPSLHQHDNDPTGFEWLNSSDAASSTLSFLRHSDADSGVLVVCNLTPVPREMLVGVPETGAWQEILNSDSTLYGGSGLGNQGRIEAANVPAQGQPFSATLVAPPLAIVMFRHEPSQ